MRSVIAASILMASVAVAADDSATAAVERYVQDTRHWRHSDYRIARYRDENQYVVFLVSYIPDDHHVLAGHVGTFEAYYDPASHKVVKEMRFQ